jgi:hypothetical protein
MWDRLQAKCQNPPSLAPVLLAHVMVHEVTHVLQGMDHHSDTGVMKARWTSDDYKKMLWDPLPFTDYDATLVRLGLEGLRESCARMPIFIETEFRIQLRQSRVSTTQYIERIGLVSGHGFSRA